MKNVILITLFIALVFAATEGIVRQHTTYVTPLKKKHFISHSRTNDSAYSTRTSIKTKHKGDDSKPPAF